MSNEKLYRPWERALGVLKQNIREHPTATNIGIASLFAVGVTEPFRHLKARQIKEQLGKSGSNPIAGRRSTLALQQARFCGRLVLAPHLALAASSNHPSYISSNTASTVAFIAVSTAVEAVIGPAERAANAKQTWVKNGAPEPSIGGWYKQYTSREFIREAYRGNSIFVFFNKLPLLTVVGCIQPIINKYTLNVEEGSTNIQRASNIVASTVLAAAVNGMLTPCSEAQMRMQRAYHPAPNAMVAFRKMAKNATFSSMWKSWRSRVGITAASTVAMSCSALAMADISSWAAREDAREANQSRSR